MPFRATGRSTRVSHEVGEKAKVFIVVFMGRDEQDRVNWLNRFRIG